MVIIVIIHHHDNGHAMIMSVLSSWGHWCHRWLSTCDFSVVACLPRLLLLSLLLPRLLLLALDLRLTLHTSTRSLINMVAILVKVKILTFWSGREIECKRGATKFAFNGLLPQSSPPPSPLLALWIIILWHLSCISGPYPVSEAALLARPGEAVLVQLRDCPSSPCL